MANKAVEIILQRYEQAKNRKRRTDNLRYEAGKYVWPSAKTQLRSSMPTGDEQPPFDLYDSTAIMAAYKMTSGIFSYLMPVGARWFQFAASDYELNQDKFIQQWLSMSTAAVHKEIWRSNFQREMFIAIRSMIVFGTGVISVEEIDGELIFKSHHIGSMVFDDNNKGEIDTAYRQISYTARQAMQEFGIDSLSKGIRKAIDAGKLEEKFEFVHVCAPNEDFSQFSLAATNKKIKSLYICINDKEIISLGGFDELPYLVLRFSRVPGEIMGNGPAIELLPEIKMLNRMKRTFIEASEKQVDPPLIMEDDGVIGQPVTNPNGTIYIRPGAMVPQPLNTGVNVQLNAEIIAAQQQIVKEAFFNDLFQALAEHKNMTATEVVQRVEEKIVYVSPATTSLQNETFDLLITRVLNLLIKAKVIEPPPQELGLEIIYQGRLALAMSNIQTNAIEATLAKWQPYAETTDVFANVDFDTSFRTSWLNSGAPAEGLTDYRKMLKEREEVKQMQQAQQQAELAESASKAYRNVSKSAEAGSVAEQLI